MKLWAGLVLGLVLAGCHPQDPQTDALPKQVLGTPYVQARRILLSQGFKTAVFAPTATLRRRAQLCEDLEGQRCRTYSEAWDCKGVGDCEMDFVRAADHRVLLLRTDGEFPPSVGDAHWATPEEAAARAIANK